MTDEKSLDSQRSADFNPLSRAAVLSHADDLMFTSTNDHTSDPANNRGAQEELRSLYDQLDNFRGAFSSISTRAVEAATPAVITWKPPVYQSELVTELATPRLLDRALYRADTIREGKRYPKQKNIQGLYAMASTGHHVWHESELEANVLRRYDLRGDVVAVASQPFTITFADEAEHTPDLLLLLADHRQVVVDVKAAAFLPKAIPQFEKTHAVCRAVGWSYEVHWDASKQVTVNIDRLSVFKHPGYHPGAEREQRLLDWLAEPRTLVEAAIATNPRTVPEGRSAVLHLLWTGSLTIDLTKPINDRSLIGRTSK